MTERTRKETAQSGLLLIFIGISSAFATLGIGMLQLYNIHGWMTPALFITSIVNAIAGYIIVTKKEKNARVQSYTRTLFWNVWLICGIAALLFVFPFPYLNIYSVRAIPVLVAIIMGIALYITGVLFELKFIQLTSFIWWIGAIIMSTLNTPYKFMIMVAVILLGWVLPGFMLLSEYKKRSE